LAIDNPFMQPEISHRCASCGASIREPAMFCPDCGKPLSEATPEPEPQIAAAAAAPAVANVPAQDSVKKSDPPAVSKTGTYGKARDSLHRASTATREALADNVKRVEKIRHVSSVVLGEATYDPSLRFVLVAIGIFVVFLVLLLLSKVMG
jgi:predicted  nucleic acid-binding Zn-ribbon protein